MTGLVWMESGTFLAPPLTAGAALLERDLAALGPG